MKLVATMPMRNEQWCVGVALRALLHWVDEVVVLDHASTDRSGEIVRQIAGENPGRVLILSESNPEWQEMRHRQWMLEEARLRGASHVVMVDADELLTGNLLDSIRGFIGGLPAGSILQLPWVCLARSLDRFYAAGIWYNNWVCC